MGKQVINNREFISFSMGACPTARPAVFLFSQWKLKSQEPLWEIHFFPPWEIQSQPLFEIHLKELHWKSWKMRPKIQLKELHWKSWKMRPKNHGQLSQHQFRFFEPLLPIAVHRDPLIEQ